VQQPSDEGGGEFTTKKQVDGSNRGVEQLTKTTTKAKHYQYYLDHHDQDEKWLVGWC